MDPEVARQLRALSEQNGELANRINLLAKTVAANNQNLIEFMGLELRKVQDAADKATRKVTEFGGHLDEFTSEQKHFRGEFDWWSAHLSKLKEKLDKLIKDTQKAEARLEIDNATFKQWATTKINQIGRIFRR